MVLMDEQQQQQQGEDEFHHALHEHSDSSDQEVEDEDVEVEEGEIVEEPIIKKMKKKKKVLLPENGIKKIKFKLGKSASSDVDPKKRRVCEICKRSFSSGKALGGHMRVHYNYQEVKKGVEEKDIEDEDEEDDVFDRNLKEKLKLKSSREDSHSPNKQRKMKMRLMMEIPTSSSKGIDSSAPPDHNQNTTCVLCSKTFLSMKSLFGHMRCHPEREWRGIHPPKFPNPNIAAQNPISNTSSSIVDDEIDSSPSYDLPRWTCTGKRGRKSSIGASSGSHQQKSEEDDDRVPEAVNNLLLLAHHAQLELTESSRRSVDSDAAYSNSKKQQKIDIWKDLSDEENDDSWRLAVLRNKKKMKLAEAEDKAEEAEYRCVTCNKCFPSHQALGGHRSKICNKVYVPPPLELVHDLINELPSPSKQLEHRCQICKKTFPSGQALGGHKRCHWNGNLPIEAHAEVEAPLTLTTATTTTTATSSVASKEEEDEGSKNVFSFDLNVVPILDEDEQELGFDLKPPGDPNASSSHSSAT